MVYYCYIIQWQKCTYFCQKSTSRLASRSRVLKSVDYKSTKSVDGIRQVSRSHDQRLISGLHPYACVCACALSIGNGVFKQIIDCDAPSVGYYRGRNTSASVTVTVKVTGIPYDP